ncbi:hemin uptake protein HemP [Novilysobacter erysipheiresistens]|uniref:Hemin uptake protein HemP n=1 Tax=Novilysobacter erysipheiresistens TaxID=1749332 RepID=A0ABU7Z1J0_9GAMM
MPAQMSVAVAQLPPNRLQQNLSRPVLRLAQPVGPGAFDSNALLRGTREVLIQHGGETYRLRHTRNDKLILTK